MAVACGGSPRPDSHDPAGKGVPDSIAAAQDSKDSGPARRHRIVSAGERDDAVTRAEVWRAPEVPIRRANLGDGRDVPSRLDCWFTLTTVGGTTPKFDCELDTAEEIRIKYGYGAETHAEVAATRLLRALGFGADAVTMVERLRCYGCPREPFTTSRVVEATHSRGLYARALDYRDHQDFEWVALERRFPALAIESERTRGWAMFELDRVDPSKGGAPRTHVDAIRLMAIFLAHWDNKAANQRLVCLAERWADGTPCPRTFLLLHDLGATFGPRKVDLHDWEAAAIWEDRASCVVSMRDMPHGGATFGRARVTESGRRFAADLLGQITDAQLAELFGAARFDRLRGPFRENASVSEWVRVFKARAAAIRNGPPCPEP